VDQFPEPADCATSQTLVWQKGEERNFHPGQQKEGGLAPSGSSVGLHQPKQSKSKFLRGQEMLSALPLLLLAVSCKMFRAFMDRQVLTLGNGTGFVE